jgi:DNA-binding transcriptional MerR regulator
MASDSKPAFLADYNTESEQAEQIGVTTRTLRNWRRERLGPPVTIIANRIYYYRPSTVKWFRDQEQAAKGSRQSSTQAA